MEPDLTWLAIIPPIIALLFIVLFKYLFKVFEELGEEAGELAERAKFKINRLKTFLKEHEERLSKLEAGKSTSAIGNKILDRLSKIEEIVEPLKESPKFSSPEYSLLQYQINKLNESREDLQNRLERMIEQKFNSFRSGFTIWMFIITLLFTLAIALLIYLLPK